MAVYPDVDCLIASMQEFVSENKINVVEYQSQYVVGKIFPPLRNFGV
jgi:hypothetical protein